MKNARILILIVVLWVLGGCGDKKQQNDVSLVKTMNVDSSCVKKYLDEGNTTSWIFNAFPAGFGDVFGNGVQAYVSGEKTWDEVVSDCKDAWSKARSK